MTKTYLLIGLLTYLDCLLVTCKTKALIHGHDRIANILRSIAKMVYIIVVSQVVIEKDIVGIIVVGVSEFLGGESGVKLFNFIFESKFFNKIFKIKTKDKTRKYKVYFRTLQECLECYLQLYEEGIKVFKNEESKKLTVYSYTKDDSRFIRDAIEDSYEGLEVIPVIKKV